MLHFLINARFFRQPGGDFFAHHLAVFHTQAMHGYDHGALF